MSAFNKQASLQSGFTLIEVALAVLILGAGLTTLVALHTRYVAAYMLEQQTTQAALLGQYIMAVREARGENPELGEREDDLVKRLDDYGFFDGRLVKEDSLPLEGWTVRESVSPVDLPQLENALQRDDLQIIWGERDDEQFTLTSFRRAPRSALGAP